MADGTSIEERAKIHCGVCGCEWSYHPIDVICWRYRPKCEVDNGVGPASLGGTAIERAEKDMTAGGIYLPTDLGSPTTSGHVDAQPARQTNGDRQPWQVGVENTRALNRSLVAARAEVARLREVIAPFAEQAAYIPCRWEGSWYVDWSALAITNEVDMRGYKGTKVADWRRLRDAYDRKDG